MLTLFEPIIDYIFPPTCLACGEFTLKSHSFCSKCWSEFNFIAKPYCKDCGMQFELPVFDAMSCGKCIKHPPAYDYARSLLKFDKNSKKIIHSFKYHDKIELSTLFSRLLYKTYNEQISHVDYVIPVPMHRFKRLLRMYNQADLLCIALAKLMNKPRIPDILIKTRWTKSQVYLTRRARKENLRSSIRLNPKYNIKGKTILLVDDVMTTGTTLDYCSKLLKKGGAKAVIALTVATT